MGHAIRGEPDEGRESGGACSGAARCPGISRDARFEGQLDAGPRDDVLLVHVGFAAASVDGDEADPAPAVLEGGGPSKGVSADLGRPS
ncbi:MAG: hypothetical protein ABSC94_01320 [Polyangiaceae bacterium]|jgi:hypothetical protein